MENVLHWARAVNQREYEWYTGKGATIPGRSNGVPRITAKRESKGMGYAASLEIKQPLGEIYSKTGKG